MNIWTSKGSLAALSLFLLTACDGVPLTLPGAPGASQALSQVSMAAGTVTLVAPQGYCIDKRSVRPRFALMARCDVLGASAAAALGAPIGIMTVSLAEANEAAPLPGPADTARAAGLTEVTDAVASDGVSLFRAVGPVPVEGLSPRHWRGTARVGGQILGVALYGPADSNVQTDEGRLITREVIERTQAAS